MLKIQAMFYSRYTSRYFVIEGFLLSRREGMMGTPERPLSDLGRISYLNYWLSAILEHLHHSLDPNHPKKITIKSKFSPYIYCGDQHCAIGKCSSTRSPRHSLPCSEWNFNFIYVGRVILSFKNVISALELINVYPLKSLF